MVDISPTHQFMLLNLLAQGNLHHSQKHTNIYDKQQSLDEYQFNSIKSTQSDVSLVDVVLHLSNLPNFDMHLKTIMAVLRGICENMTVQTEGGDCFVSIVLFVKCQTIVRSAQYN